MDFRSAEAAEQWPVILNDLSQQMTAATFEQWLRGTDAMIENGNLVVICHSSFAVDWLQNRLHDTIARAVRGVAGADIQIEYRLRGQTITSQQQDAAVPPATAGFPGFEPIRSNFVMTPRQFYEVVLTAETPTVTAVVAAVISNTYGVIVNYHTGEMREWWDASFDDVCTAAGIASRVSVRRAVRQAVAAGYIVVRDGRRGLYSYRLRRLGEPAQTGGIKN